MPHGWDQAETKRREWHAILLEYQYGKTLTELAAIHRVRRQTVSDRLRKAYTENGLSPPHNFRRISGIRPAQVAGLYRQPA